MYDFSVDYNIIDNSNIIDIHKYLMKKHDTNNVWIYKKNVIGLLACMLNASNHRKCVSLNN